MYTLSGPAAAVMLDTTLKATVLLVLAIVVTHALRGARASVRLRLLMVSLLGAVALVPLAALLPSWSFPLAPDPLAGWASRSQLVEAAEITPAASAAAASTFSGPQRLVSAAQPPSKPLVRTAAPVERSNPGRSGSPLGGWLPSLPAALGLVWLLGVVWSLWRQLQAHRQLAQMRRNAVEEADLVTRRLLREATAVVGLKRSVRLLTGNQLSGPITWGHFDPVVLLPQQHVQWSDERRRVVLLHELAHIKRGDWLVRSWARSACALYWFHPLAWFAFSRLIVEQEQACDEAVVALGTPASRYAQHLLSLAREDNCAALTIPTLALPMARRPQLEIRLMSILRLSAQKTQVHNRVLAAVSMLLVTGLVPVLAAVAPWTQEEQTPTREQALDELRVVARELEQTSEKLEPYEARLEALEVELEPIETVIESAEGEIRPFEEQLEAIEGEMEPFEVELEAFEALLEPHEARLAELEGGLEPFETQLELVMVELEPLEEQLEQFELQLEPFQIKMEEVEVKFLAETKQLEQELKKLELEGKQLDGAQLGELRRLGEELSRASEPFRQQMEQIHAEMEPVLAEVHKLRQEMEPVHKQMQHVHQQMEPNFERLREIHEEMEPTFEEMRTVHERMEPIYERMRVVHEQMEPAMARMHELHVDMEPVHERMREVHREMEPVHEEMQRLADRFERSSLKFLRATLREELAALNVGEDAVVAVADAVRDSLNMNVENNRLRFDGSRSAVAKRIRETLREFGVSGGDIETVSNAAARALTSLEVEFE